MKSSVSPSLLVTFVLVASSQAFSADVGVHDGCAKSSRNSTEHSFFIDPTKGDMANDGSMARPWRTLAEVVGEKSKLIATQAYAGNYQNSDRKLQDQNPSGPIKPGDVIYLMSGNHGNVQISGAINKEFISVLAAPGQTPMLSSLRVDGSSKWMFAGLKIQSGADSAANSRGLITFGRNQWRGPTDNIILVDSSVSTTDDTSGWSDMDWVKKPYEGGLITGATCVTISRNLFYNLRNAIYIDGNKTLVENNRINNFGNDAIDIVASDLVIRNNTITNGRNTKSETLHADGIQGWTGKNMTNRNVVIDGNTIIKTGDSKVSYLQGITIFDGEWDGLTISNNVVVTNHWHGISVYGATNAQILNNTVVAYDPVNYPTWIVLKKGKEGKSPQNVVIRNNITTELGYVTGPTIKVDHNIVAGKITATAEPNSGSSWSKPGTYGDGNVIDPNIYGSMVRVDNVKGEYDLRLKRGSPAIGAGNPNLAPATDIIGKHRAPPVDIGAYVH